MYNKKAKAQADAEKAKRYTLTLKLKTNWKDSKYLDKVFRLGNQVYNRLISYIKKQLHKLKIDKAYHQALVRYAKLCETNAECETSLAALQSKLKEKAKQQNVDVLDDVKAKINDLTCQMKVLAQNIDDMKTVMNVRVDYYGLTDNDLYSYVKVQRQKYEKYLDAHVCQSLAKQAYSALYAVLYKRGKEVHFRKWSDMHTLSGKKNTQGIKCRGNKLCWQGHEIEIQFPKRKDKHNRGYWEKAFHSKIVLCRIKRLIFGSGWSYYIELVMDGLSPKHHVIGTGNAGIDIGTSTIAVDSDNSCMLKSLSSGVKTYDKEIASLNRRMDDSKRTLNPGNYNPDGTVKKGKKTWAFSTHYKQMQRRRMTLYRKARDARKQSRDVLVNEILAMGSMFYVETMNFKGLQKRAKETHKTGEMIEVTRSDDTKHTVEKNSKTKRFGKSIAVHAPAALIAALEKKASMMGGSLKKVSTASFKASQYNHATGEFDKTDLNTRSKIIDGELVQRDLYSSFLLRHSTKDGTHPNQRKCKKDFAAFLKRQQVCITALKAGNDNNSCFGLADFKN